MNTNTFEDYLMEVHAKEHPELLDDELSDAFDGWVNNVGPHEIVRYANQYSEGLENKLAEAFRLAEKMQKIAETSVEELQKIQTMVSKLI